MQFEEPTVVILPGGWLDTENAAKYLDYARNTLERWRTFKKGPPYTKGGGEGNNKKVYYRKKDLDKWMAGK